MKTKKTECEFQKTRSSGGRELEEKREIEREGEREPREVQWGSSSLEESPSAQTDHFGAT